MNASHSVVIIGAGPAGLTAANRLVAAGLRDVLVLERNPQPGGLPRFCDHPGWGLVDLRRFLRGPAYAAALVRRAAGAEIATDVTVTALEPGGLVRVATPAGTAEISARAVLLATGTRELPRGPRLVSGTRPWGVTTTGAFQELCQAGLRPFRRPVIVGSELVAFSALLTARHAGIGPVAMVEAADRITARWPGASVARFAFGVPVLTGARVLAIEGDPRVEAVRIERAGATMTLACDSVIFTGRFVPEAFLARTGRLAVDAATGGPVIDNLYRCSDPTYFAAGNVLRPVEHSGFAAREGALAAAAILRALGAGLPDPARGVAIAAVTPLRYVTPQRLVRDGARIRLHARLAEAAAGRLRVMGGSAPLAERRVRALPERRLTLDVPAAALGDHASLRLELV